MAGLDQHFGENASLDPATQADILRFLELNAADAGSSQLGRRVMQGMGTKTPLLRVTETRWFVRKHDEVPRSAWTRKSVGAAANCAACHRKAEQGASDDHSVRIPK